MGKCKRKTLQLKPFCYYCDRTFENERILILHQRARHFACRYCSRKLEAATGLVVHLLQVHKRALTSVPHALEDRSSTNINIRGMFNVPEELIQEKLTNLKLDVERTKNKNNYKHTIFCGDLIYIENNKLIIRGLSQDSELYKVFCNSESYILSNKNASNANHKVTTLHQKNIPNLSKVIMKNKEPLLVTQPILNYQAPAQPIIVPNQIVQHDINPAISVSSPIDITIVEAPAPANAILAWAADNISIEEWKAIMFYNYIF